MGNLTPKQAEQIRKEIVRQILEARTEKGYQNG
jgi:hypothetical protein